MGRMDDLRVELDAVPAFGVVGHSSKRRARVARKRRESAGQTLNVVAVTHPHLLRGLEPSKERVGAVGGDAGVAVLALGGTHHAATECVALELHAVADAQDGNATLQHPLGHLRCAIVVDAGRATRQDDASELIVGDCTGWSIMGNEFRVDANLTEPAHDELGCL